MDFEAFRPPCCLCGEAIEFIGHNAAPVANGRCCDACNFNTVIPHRLSVFSTGYVQVVRNSAKITLGIQSNALNAVKALRDDTPCVCSAKKPLCLECTTKNQTCEKVPLDTRLDDEESETDAIVRPS